jgi:hypothetical protein
MATLSNPTFEIDLLTGMPGEAIVTATVNVELEPLETFLVGAGLGLELRSELRGEDRGFLNERDDRLFFFPTQNITNGGTYTFEATVSRGILNEDNSSFLDRTDEVYNNFSLVSTSNIFPLNTSINSPIIQGQF